MSCTVRVNEWNKFTMFPNDREGVLLVWTLWLQNDTDVLDLNSDLWNPMN